MDFSKVKRIVLPEGEASRIVNDAGTVLWEKAATPAYTFVDYLNVPASTSLDTGLTCKSTDYLSMDFAPMVSSMYGNVVHAGNNSILRIYIDGKSIQAKIGWYSQTIATVSIGTRVNAAFENQIVTYGDGSVLNMQAVTAFTADTNLLIGGCSGATRIYGLKFGTGSTSLSLDLAPAVRASDGAAGFYNKVSGDFTPFGTAP